MVRNNRMYPLGKREDKVVMGRREDDE